MRFFGGQGLQTAAVALGGSAVALGRSGGVLIVAAAQLQALVKGFAFWPQITMGQLPLDAAQQRQVADSAADMFLRFHEVEVGG